MTDYTPKCFECSEGILTKVPIDYTAELSDNRQLVVKGVEVFKCVLCGEVSFDADACEAIESEIKRFAGEDYFTRR